MFTAIKTQTHFNPAISIKVWTVSATSSATLATNMSSSSATLPTFMSPTTLANWSVKLNWESSPPSRSQFTFRSSVSISALENFYFYSRKIWFFYFSFYSRKSRSEFQISLSTLEIRDRNFKFLFLLSKFEIRISNFSFYSRNSRSEFQISLSTLEIRDQNFKFLFLLSNLLFLTLVNAWYVSAKFKKSLTILISSSK